MKSFPPEPEDQVSLKNWRVYPYNKWSFNHVSELIPSAFIRTENHQTIYVSESSTEWVNEEIEIYGERISIKDWLLDTQTDSFIVKKDNRIVREWYGDGVNPNVQHLLMSVSKSLLGIIVGILIDRGAIDPNDRLVKYVPELKGTAYSNASVQQALDMECAVRFEEDYETRDGAFGRYRRAQLWDPARPGEDVGDIRSFICTLNQRTGVDGEVFHYMSPTPDMLGWVIERATQTRFVDLISDLLWKPMGATADAYITVDSLGAPRCAGGICSTLRDLAQVGQIIADNGVGRGGQIISEKWIAKILTRGNVDAWCKGDFYEFYDNKDMYYKDYWYIQNGSNPVMFAAGAFGQNLYIDKSRNLVVAKLSAQKAALEPQMLNMTDFGIRQIMDRV